VEDYREVVVNKIRLFLPRKFTPLCDLTIDVEKFMGISILHIEGWKLI
jgi:hypothetical protein